MSDSQLAQGTVDSRNEERRAANAGPEVVRGSYVCWECGEEFSGPYIRCIGVDGDHRPVVPQWRAKS